MFHMGTDIPTPVSTALDHESAALTPMEFSILREQIRKNSDKINEYIERLDLFVNKEKYPQEADFIVKIRRRLELLMEENDTFRQVIWKHDQRESISEE